MALFLSDLLHARVRDRQGAVVGRLRDLVVRQLADTADIRGLVIQRNRRLAYLPMTAVATLGPGHIMLREAPTWESPPPDEEVWLIRDLLDAQVIDVTGARVVRVNDIVLEPQPGRLLIVSMDVGNWGLLRRLGWAPAARWLATLFGLRAMEKFIPWVDIAPLSKDPTQVQLMVALDRIKCFPPDDLASVVDEMGWQQRQHLCRTLSDTQLANLLHESRPELQVALLDEMGSARTAAVVAVMTDDAVADLIASLPPNHAETVGATLPAARAAAIERLLSDRSRPPGSSPL